MKIGQAVAEILRFLNFQYGGHHVSDFQKFAILTVGRLYRANLRHCARFSEDRLAACAVHKGAMLYIADNDAGL